MSDVRGPHDYTAADTGTDRQVDASINSADASATPQVNDTLRRAGMVGIALGILIIAVGVTISHLLVNAAKADPKMSYHLLCAISFYGAALVCCSITFVGYSNIRSAIALWCSFLILAVAIWKTNEFRKHLNIPPNGTAVVLDEKGEVVAARRAGEEHPWLEGTVEFYSDEFELSSERMGMTQLDGESATFTLRLTLQTSDPQLAAKSVNKMRKVLVEEAQAANNMRRSLPRDWTHEQTMRADLSRACCVALQDLRSLECLKKPETLKSHLQAIATMRGFTIIKCHCSFE